MTKYVFLNMPAYGLVNPTLALAQELVKRGQDVIYYLPELFQDAVQATGAVFRRYDSKLKSISPMPTTSGIGGGALSTLMVEESRHVLPQVLDSIRAEQPDFIVYGAMCLWARIVIQVLNVPAIALRPTYAMNEHFNMSSMMAQQRNQNVPNMRDVLAKVNAGMAEVCETYHVPPVDLRSAFVHAEPLNIVFLPKAFQPAADTFDERYLFVGPSILPRNEATDFPLDTLSNERPLLYISLGTVFTNQPEFFKMCFEAFGEQPWQVVLSWGRQVDSATLGPVPDNFLVAPYVPQLDILPRTHVFVTHGGMNSVMESLYYGVPMVVIPQQVEQAMTARRIAEMGLGIALENDAVDVTTLREAVERVTNEAAFRQRVQHMQQVTREAGGYKRAADAIMQFTQEHTRV